MNPCECLARIGFNELLGEPTEPHDPDDRNSIAQARRRDHERVREALLSVRPEAVAERDSVRWVRLITWPDRVPGLKTWAGQVTLAKIIAKNQALLHQAEEEDLFEVRGVARGSSGLDAQTSPNALEIGFSLDRQGMAIEQRPALELLAIVGLETVPIVSFGLRECGLIHAGLRLAVPRRAADGWLLSPVERP